MCGSIEAGPIRGRGDSAMSERERRSSEEQTAARLRHGLTAAQLRALETLEQFH